MKKYILPVLVLGLMLLVACEGGEDPVTNGGAFIGGTDGLLASFEPLSVLDDGVYTIFDTEDFPLEVILNNKGEQTLVAGEVTLKLLGPAKPDFDGISSWELQNNEEIEKISEFNPSGGEEVISFTPNAYAKYKSEVIGYTDITWNLEYDYNYKTYLIVNDVCFKEDTTDPKVCTVKEAKTFSVSSAPITVTSVEEDAGGKGIILVKVAISFDQVSYVIDEPELWECKSGGREGEARLVDGTAEVICRLKEPLAEGEIYTKPVKLTFEYVYKELIQEKLRVKESAE